MKKAFPWILGGVVLVLLLIMMSAATGGARRKMDQRVTLRQADKIPYGTRVARELLGTLFPSAALPYDRRSPGLWDSVDVTETNQAVILIADYLDAERSEMRELGSFVEKGNYVFIIARAASDDVTDYFDFTYSSQYGNSNFSNSDSLRLKLGPPFFNGDSLFTYPGIKYEGSLASVNNTTTAVLGRNAAGQPDFVQLTKGRGRFFIHAVPLAFSNYFILHKNNAAYYKQALSVIPNNVTTVLWNEYYLEKLRNEDNKEPNWLGALLSYPSFKWGLFIGAGTLLLFMLLGMRRKQRMIPPHDKPTNDSLDFVKTLGRLYYDRRDHKNLAAKMTAYFLDHVRSVYKIPTHILNDEFMQALHYKSGYAEPELRSLVATIHTVRLAPAITEKQLAGFYNQLEAFYQNT